MARGSKPGEHRGGRKPGIPNKKTFEIVEKLEALKCDPIQGMAKLALDPKNTPELRGKMFSELAQYVFPKRKAIEHKGIPPGGVVALTLDQVVSEIRTLREKNA